MQSGDLSLESLLDSLATKVAEKLRAELAQAGNGGAIRPRLLTIEQGAAYLGRSEEAMRHLIQAGKIPTVRADRRIYLDIADLDAWIAANKQAGLGES